MLFLLNPQNTQAISLTMVRLMRYFIVVHVIGTLPEYHRNGLGSRLLTRFTDDADKAGAKAYLQATQIGANLYPRLGWRDIEDMVTQTPNGPVVWRCMMREPYPLRN
jgi:GNAT superfamily N-acetyltransferase